MLDPRTQPVLALATSEKAPCRLLSPEERRLYACLSPHRRADWRAARVAAKRAVASSLGLADPARVEVLPVREGAPRVRLTGPAPWTSPALPRVSLTHRDGRAAAAADPRRAVGVDLERAGVVRRSTERYFLSARERRESPLDATSLWALKEAAWKALTCDAATPFHALELRFGADGALDGIALRGRSHSARSTLSSPWPGYVLAVVWLEEVDA